jgi:hypothetical protein
LISSFFMVVQSGAESQIITDEDRSNPYPSAEICGTIPAA